MEKKLYRPKEAAAYLGIGNSTFWLYVKRGMLSVKKLSERVTVIDKQQLDNFINV